MSERSADQYVGFLVPFQETSADIWAAQSSYTQANPGPGSISYSPRSRLRLSVAGTQEATEYVIATRRGGHISPGEAGFTWRKSTDAADQERGWDPPVSVTGYRPVSYGPSSVSTNRHPDRCLLPDGSILICVYTALPGSAAYRVYTYRITGNGEISAAVMVYSTSTAPTAVMSSHLSPSCTVLDDGSVIVGHMVEDATNEEAQWRVHRSTDNGATWATISDMSLPSPINVDNATGSGATGYTIRRCRMRHTGGDTLLIVEGLCNDAALPSRNMYRQYSSTSDGTGFILIEEMSGIIGSPPAVGFGFHDVAVFDGGFIVSFVQSVDSLHINKIPDSSRPISGVSDFSHAPGDTVGVISSNSISDGNTSIWSSADGSVYLAWRAVSGGDSACRIAVAHNGLRYTDATPSTSFKNLGTGFNPSVGGANWWSAGVSGLYPADFVGLAAHGRSSVFGVVEAATTTTYEGSLFELHLGGWSNVNMPALDVFGTLTRRAGWKQIGLPVELPNNAGWSQVSTGSPSTGLVNGRLQADASSGTLYWQIAPTATATAIFEFSCTLNTSSGGISTMRTGARVQLEGSITGYESQIRLDYSTAVIAFYDGTAPSLIAQVSVDWSNAYEIRIAQKGASAQAWYRVRDLSSDRQWVLIGSTTTLSSTGGGGTSYIKFGPAHQAGTVESDWYSWHYADQANSGMISLPISNPGDTFARDYAGLGRSVYVEGMKVSAVAGPARQGETATLAPRFGDQIGSINNALHSVATPRRAWRQVPIDVLSTTTCPEQTIAYQTGPDGVESHPLSEIIGLHVARATFCAGAIQRKDTSSGWVDVVTFDLCAETTFTGTRTGRTVRPTAGTTGRWVDRDELRGGWCRIGNSAPYKWRKIAANTPGLLAAASSGLAAVLDLDGIDNTEPAGAVTMAVIAPDVTILAHTAGETAEGWRVKITAQNCATDAMQAGCLWLGYVVVPGQRWELGDRCTLISGTTTSRQSDGTIAVREVAPDRREIEIGWTALNATQSLQGGSADPDHALASALSGARPVAAPDSPVGDMVGLVRRCRGALVPVVVLPRVIALTGGTALQTIWRRDEQIRARFDGEVSVRHVTGDEGDPAGGLGYRLESIPLVEIV